MEFPPAIRPANPRKAVPWGTSKRQARAGLYPESMLVALGQIDVSPQVQQGGVVQRPMFLRVNVQEVVRCTTLAIRRRTRLLGPMAEHDQLLNQIWTDLSGRVGPANHWSEAWVGVEQGVALEAAGKEGQAVLALQRSLLAGGEFDHPLTSVALLELGRLAMLRGDTQTALKYFEEASYAAVLLSGPWSP